MLFQFFAPQRLESPATAVQRIDFGKVGKLAQQITKINFTGGHSCVFYHLKLLNDQNDPNHLNALNHPNP